MSQDPVKAAARKRKYRLNRKIEKYGPDAVSQDMRGRHGNHARGAANGRWNEGRMLSDSGYVKVRVGRSHPLADPNGYAYEHKLVWVAAGLPLPGHGFEIHHKDEDKTNNRIENLELKSKSDHMAHHSNDRARDNSGRFASA